MSDHVPSASTTSLSRKVPGKEDFVRSLASGLKVLECFSDAEAAMTLSEVARRTGLSRATARRMLHTLIHLGYASTDGRDFTLTPKVLSLGLGFWSGNSLKDLLQPALHDLAAELNESCSASILVGDEIVYIARVHTRRIMRMDLDVGTRLPAFATSMGRVLLSDVDQTSLYRLLEGAERPQFTPATITEVEELVKVITRGRNDGYVMVDQELEAGLRSVAVPVKHPDRGVTTAINVSVSAGLEPAGESLKRVLPSLKRCAETAAQALQAWERGRGRRA
ncbi:IclR family transcriptional regulator domain-containing protein [Nesterenkonia ebinurensis]|uniref:IclR family transcriptional regulator domain-containing protein n=1 Tax=Nesterenkonia ebinurensis TaxID=2608252 RepID=UPI00123CFCFB|nr:IclR family transcriptional regulator C-terminal domain-containing protein [Nesterenkonia ebinurensis]